MTFTPRPYQAEAVQAIFKYFWAGNTGNPLVVAPTGSGKSIIIADFCKEVLDRWPDQNILIISHVKEILQQNYAKIKSHCKKHESSLYSAGLNQKKISKITVAGIQSIYNKPELFSQFDIVIVDEAHTIPRNGGMYNKLFEEIKKPIIGFTATPYRLGTGFLHIGEGAFFDEIVYTIQIKRLQEEGYLCILSTKGTENKLDASNIKKQAGDYILKELSAAFDRTIVTKEIIAELLIYKHLRKKWLLFAIDIDHAEHINDELRAAGINSAVVHSKMAADRAVIIDEFNNPDGYQCLVSVAVLTTGFDSPHVDLIGLLRPTASPVLHVQIIGRGLRPAEGKDDCLVLDFAGNLLRNGPIDAPVIKAAGKGGGEAVMKECPNCREIVYAAVRTCPLCSYKFQFKHNLSTEASQNAAISKEEWYNVTEVMYEWYLGKKGIPMIKVNYLCGIRSFKEFVCIEHGGFAAHKAARWWQRRNGGKLPETARNALQSTDRLRTPVRILVDESGKYETIKSHEF